eukprot:6397377-Prymnesium_polylepis.1
MSRNAGKGGKQSSTGKGCGGIRKQGRWRSVGFGYVVLAFLVVSLLFRAGILTLSVWRGGAHALAGAVRAAALRSTIVSLAPPSARDL